jgi:hypothetical protein
MARMPNRSWSGDQESVKIFQSMPLLRTGRLKLTMNIRTQRVTAAHKKDAPAKTAGAHLSLKDIS